VPSLFAEPLHIGNVASLGVIVTALAVAVVASLIRSRRLESAEQMIG